MTPKQDIIGFAEQYRDFHFIPGNTYNQDVVEKVRLAEALLLAVGALERIEDWKEDWEAKGSDGSKPNFDMAADEAMAALSRIRSLSTDR